METKKAIKMFNVGDTICIKDNGLDSTNKAFTATEEMHNMVGQHFELKNITHSKRRGMACMSAGGWSWSADDMYVIKRAKHGKLENDMGQAELLMFDPQTL